MDWFWIFLAWLARLPLFEREVARTRMQLQIAAQYLLDIAADEDLPPEALDAMLRDAAMCLQRLNAYAGCLIHQRARALAGRSFQQLRQPRFAQPRRTPTIDALLQAILAIHRRLENLEADAQRLAASLTIFPIEEPACSIAPAARTLAALPQAHAPRALELSG